VNDVLNDDPLIGKDGDLLTRLSIDVLALKSVGQPRTTGKVNCLADVKACAEACMVASWQCEHELALFLECFVDAHLKNVKARIVILTPF